MHPLSVRVHTTTLLYSDSRKKGNSHGTGDQFRPSFATWKKRASTIRIWNDLHLKGIFKSLRKAL
jgi:hypothetical protein